MCHIKTTAKKERIINKFANVKYDSKLKHNKSKTQYTYVTN